MFKKVDVTVLDVVGMYVGGLYLIFSAACIGYCMGRASKTEETQAQKLEN